MVLLVFLFCLGVQQYCEMRHEQLKSSLLIGGYPLMVLPRLAVLIGLNEAIVLQQVHYWIRQNIDMCHQHDGRFWCYNSYEKWQKENFPFWSINTVKRTFKRLVDQGLLITGNFNRLKIDRTLWFTIDYQRMEELEVPIVSNWVYEGTKLVQPIPETSPETSKEKEEEKEKGI